MDSNQLREASYKLKRSPILNFLVQYVRTYVIKNVVVDLERWGARFWNGCDEELK